MLAAASRPSASAPSPAGHIQYLKAMATYGDGFLGRPPEFDMMMGQMEVSTTMHGGYRDHPDYVESEAMSQIYGYLSEAVAAPPAGRKKAVRITVSTEDKIKSSQTKKELITTDIDCHRAPSSQTPYWMGY